MTEVKLTPARKRALDLVREGRVYRYTGIGTIAGAYMVRNGGAGAKQANPRPFEWLAANGHTKEVPSGDFRSYYEIRLSDG